MADKTMTVAQINARLRKIEQEKRELLRLRVQLGAVDMEEVRDRCFHYAYCGKKATAILAWREATGDGLREAFKAVEAIVQEYAQRRGLNVQ